jgi:hypothetical protein
VVVAVVHSQAHQQVHLLAQVEVAVVELLHAQLP